MDPDAARPAFSTVPDFFWNAALRPWAKHVDIGVYTALCSFASGDPRAGNFARCWPGAGAIGHKVGAGRRRRPDGSNPTSEHTVRRSLDRWEANGWIYRRARGPSNALVVVVQVPEMIPVFAAAQQAHRGGDPGPLAAAISEHDGWLDDLQTRARHQTAAEATRRSRRTRTQDRPDLSTQGAGKTGQICAVKTTQDWPTTAPKRPLTGQPECQDRPDLHPEPEENQSTDPEPDGTAGAAPGVEAVDQQEHRTADGYGDDDEVKGLFAEARARMRWGAHAGVKR